MIHLEIYPSMPLYTMLVNLFAVSDQPDWAVSVFNHLKQRGLAPDLFVYRILIEMYTNLGQTEKVQELYDQMKHQQGIFLTILFYLRLIFFKEFRFDQ